MTKSPSAIFNLAHELAQQASDRELASRMKANAWFPCGFAWVRIRPARGKFVNWCKANNIGRTDSYAGGYFINAYDFSEQPGSWCQQMDVKMAAASVFAEVLRDHGINAYAESRMD